MKLRFTLFALAFFAFTAMVIGSLLYYQSLKTTVIENARAQMDADASATASRIETFLTRNSMADRAMAGLDIIRSALTNPTLFSQSSANHTLWLFQKSLNASVCYIMDRNGLTVAASNHDTSGSFIGKNYKFRPYFQTAMNGKPGVYMARGVTSAKRGIYYSEPILDSAGNPIGAAVIKTDIDLLESENMAQSDDVWLISSPEGLIFATNRADWRYRILWKPTLAQRNMLSQSRQFGTGPWSWTGLTRIGKQLAEDRMGQHFYYNRLPFAPSPKWSLYYFRPEGAILSLISEPFLKHRKAVIVIGGTFGSAFILILYFMARSDIARRKRIHDALHQKNEYLRALHEISLGLLGRLDFNELIEILLGRAGALTGTPHGFLYFYDTDGDRLELRVGLGNFRDHVGTRIEPGKGFAGWIYISGSPLYLTDCAERKDWTEQPGFAGVHALMGMPLMIGGRIMGVMGLGYVDRKKSFGNEEREILIRFSELGAIALDNARLYASLQAELAERQRAEVALKEANETLKRMVLIDGLTRIANRRCFDRHLNAECRRMIRAKQPLGLLLCDVDHFKRYNDEYGHQAGDDCLRAIAKTIAALIHREGDLVARYGGEEFAVILSNADRDGTLQVAERIRRSVMALGIAHAQNTDYGMVTISIGAAIANPDPQTPLQLLVKAADRALYRAKSEGRNRVVAEAVNTDASPES